MNVSEHDKQQREGFYRGLMNALPNTAILFFDHDLRYLEAQEAILLKYGLFSEALIGKNIFECMPHVVAQWLEPLYLRVLQGDVIEEELAYQSVSFQLHIQPIFNDHGDVIAGMVCAQDITPLKEAQAQLEERVKQLTILSGVESELTERLNIDYVLTMALDSAVRLSEAEAGFIALVLDGQMHHPHLIGNYPQHIDFKQLWGTIARAVRTQQAALIVDVQQDPDYVAVLPKTCSQIVVPLMAQDKLVGVLNLETSKAGRFTPQNLDFVKLITSRVAMAIDNSYLYQQTAKQLAEMQRLYDRVSKLEQLKTDMIRIASHDLRNPLLVIMNYLNMLISTLTDDNGAKEYARYIENAAQKMQKIIMNILSLERIEQAADDEMQVSEVDFLALSWQTYQEHQSLAKLKQLEYTFSHDDVDLWVHGDVMQLGEAMGNLIGNAIKYTPNHGCIQVIVAYDASAQAVVYQVVDNGYGIKDTQQAQLFQPFFRARMPETRDIEGTGLGLHLVKNIIERHGGAMIFESTYQQGSMFGFRLPVVS